MEITVYGRICKQCKAEYIPDRRNRCPECGAIGWYAASWPVEVESVEPVGLSEIAERVGVARQTAKTWQQRGVLPRPMWIVSGNPAWNWSDVHEWALSTGRVPV